MIECRVWNRLEKNIWGSESNGDVVSEKFSTCPIASRLCRTNQLSHCSKLVVGGKETAAGKGLPLRVFIGYCRRRQEARAVVEWSHISNRTYHGTHNNGFWLWGLREYIYLISIISKRKKKKTRKEKKKRFRQMKDVVRKKRRDAEGRRERREGEENYLKVKKTAPF